ncbi:MAG: hypothetical protein U0996_26325 [Planctomycetaceae bacterium]
MRLATAAIHVLECLTWQTRLAADGQLQELLQLSGIAVTSIRCLLGTLKAEGLVHRECIVAGILRLEQPICRWQPGMRRQKLGPVAWKLITRSRSLVRRRVMVNWATPAAASLMGGTCGQLRQPLQAEHDLGTTATLIGCLRRNPDLIWIGEDIVRRRYATSVRKVPDALIVNRDETIATAIEFGGQYSRRKLEAFRASWPKTPWEIW